MKAKQCSRLLVHEPHLWALSYGHAVDPEDSMYYRDENLAQCPGLSEERATHPVVDRHPENPRPICEMCGTWVCHSCWEYRRTRANRHPDVEQTCARCGENKGVFLACRHREDGVHPKI